MSGEAGGGASAMTSPRLVCHRCAVLGTRGGAPEEKWQCPFVSVSVSPLWQLRLTVALMWLVGTFKWPFGLFGRVLGGRVTVLIRSQRSGEGGAVLMQLIRSRD